MNINQETVNENLNNAQDGGHDQLHMTDEQICNELCAYSVDFEELEDPSELLPFVAAWRKSRA